MSCNVVRTRLNSDGSAENRSPVYVCNCNGIREREVRAAIDAGATRPADVFRKCGAQAQCARCVCEMREMIAEQRDSLKYAAE